MRLHYLALVLGVVWTFSVLEVRADLSQLLEPVQEQTVELEETIISLEEVIAKSEEHESPTYLDKLVKDTRDEGKIAFGIQAPPEAPKVYEVTEREIVARVKEKLVEYFNPEGQFKLFLKRSLKGVKAKSPNWELNITEYPASGLESRILIRAEIVSNGEVDGQWAIPLRCELWKEGFVSGKQVSRGQPLSRDDFSVQFIDVFRNRSNIIESFVDLSNYESVQTITGGRPLSWRDVRPTPAIHKGDFVEVVASEGMLRISMRGIALEDGIVNDFISIKNIQSKKNIEAQVINANTVKVYF
tara:strand:+ start:73590 stop:74489 length:900 start_codon:yes stop_codon:yes gene_type:complete